MAKLSKRFKTYQKHFGAIYFFDGIFRNFACSPIFYDVPLNK